MNQNSKHILIVDDNPDDLADMRRMLLLGSEVQFRFSQAGLGMTLIDMLGNGAHAMPDCLLLDYYLPDMDAPEVIAALQGPDGMTVCPIVVLTGAEGADLGKLVLRAGAQDFIGKESLTPIGLVRAVENAIERWTMIRELMQRERMLTARERELTSLADNTPDILSRFDHELRHVFVNKAVESMTGHAPAHFLGRTWRELSMPDALCTLWEDALRSVFKTGVPSAIEFSFDDDIHRRHYVTRLVPELDADGLVEFVLGVTHDITERWEAEKVFQENAERTQLALNAAQAGAWSWDIPSGELNWSLDNFALNARDPALGQPAYAEWEMLVHPDDRLAITTATNDAFNRVTPEFRSEYRVCLPGMNDRWLQAIGKINFSPTGQPLRMVGINLDVTDRKRTEQALRDDDRRKDEFLATLAHELRNPLAPLTTGLKILKLAPTGGPAARKTLDVMERQLRHMVHLIDDLLDVSRITNGKVELRSSRLTIQDVVAHAIEAIQPLIDAAGHLLELRMTATPIWIDGDMTRLAQVVSNLTGNAVKYTTAAGRIIVTADIKNDHAVI